MIITYISSDTNVWLDFYAISKVSLPFQLPYTYIMYKEALRREIVEPPLLIEELQNLGLEGVEISTEEFYYAVELASKYVKLSGYDRTALAMAKYRKIPILTGDGALRKAAEKEGVVVMGTIGLLDQLYSGGYIDADEYIDCLDQLLHHKERRLPEEEIRKRLRMI